MIGVVRFTFACKPDDRRMVQIIIPHCIKTISTGWRDYLLAKLAFAFTDKYDATSARRRTGSTRNGRNNLSTVRTGILDRLSSIKSKTIEVIAANPLLSIMYEKLSYRDTSSSVEIDRISPFCGTCRKIVR